MENHHVEWVFINYFDWAMASMSQTVTAITRRVAFTGWRRAAALLLFPNEATLETRHGR